MKKRTFFPGRFRKSFLTVLIVVSCMSLLVLATISEAANTQSSAVGARSRGMGGAYIAVADEPTAIYWNPAGLARAKGTILELGAAYLIPDGEYTPLGSPKTERTEDFGVAAPFLGVCSDNFGEFTLGFGIYAPYGLDIQWADDAAYNFNTIDGTVELVHYAPAVAWNLSPELSVGAAVAYARGKVKSTVNTGVPGVNLSGEVDGDSFALNAGLLYNTPVENLTLGLVWRSATDMDFDGDLKMPGFEDNVNFETTFPQVIGVGAAYKLSPEWLVAMDANWTEWSVVEEEKFECEILGDSIMARNWDDTIQLRLGTEYLLNSTWTLRGGYTYDPSPIPSETLDPGYLDGDGHMLAAGVSYKLNSMIIDLAYEYMFLDKARDVTNSIHFRPTNGEYDGSLQTIELSFNWLL